MSPNRWSIVLWLLVACSEGPARRPPDTPQTQHAADTTDTREAVHPRESRHVLGRSSLIDSLTAYVGQRPRVPLVDVAATANQQLRRLGFPFTAAIGHAEVSDGMVVVRGPEGAMLVPAPHPADTDGCGDQFASGIPVAGVSGPILHLIRRKAPRANLTSAVSTIDFEGPGVLEFATVWVGGAVTKEPRAHVIVPRLAFGNPYGVTPDGTGVLWRVPLGSGSEPWWRTQQAAHPVLATEDEPFLALKITERSIEFVADPALMTDAADKRATADRPANYPRHFDSFGFTSHGSLVVAGTPCT